MGSVFFAVLLAVALRALWQGTFDNRIKNVVSFHTGYVQVHQAGYWDEQGLDNFLALTPQLIQHLSQAPEVGGVVPRLESFALAASERLSVGCLVVGTDPAGQNRVAGLRQRLVQGRYLRPTDHGALLSAGLARKLSLGVGNTLILLGQGYHGVGAAGQFPILGVLRLPTPAQNNGLVYLPLRRAQALFAAEGRATALVLALPEPNELEAVGATLRQKLGLTYEVMNWQELLPDIYEHMKGDWASIFIISGMVYLIIAFAVYGTLLMMTMDRRYEFGVLVAVGMQKGQLALLGVAAGVAASVPLIVYLARYPIPFTSSWVEAFQRFGFEAIMPASTAPFIFINQALILLAVAAVLALYPIISV
ncbi:ABC transporter permease [Hymenobacter sp. BT188]|uniref:ABC transporter permease n=1 Tax=Hymenobacter sp. BT188 TaxID=2763504 RepID=UPI0021C6EA22|nr:ABC transporter permease [Hymenobacter sp. BT188]